MSSWRGVAGVSWPRVGDDEFFFRTGADDDWIGCKDGNAGCGRCLCPGCGHARAGARHQNRAGHVRLDGLCAAHAGRQGRHLQEKRPGCGDQDDPAEGPPPGPCLQVHPVRCHHRGDPCGLECQWRAHRADLPDGQVLRRRRHRGARQHQQLCRPQWQDHRRGCARHRPLFRPGLDAEPPPGSRPTARPHRRWPIRTSRRST